MKERKCYLCGTAEKELRPYGPKRQDVCFPCAMSTPERKAETERSFDAQLDACGNAPVIGLDVGPVPLKSVRPLLAGKP
jgi:hypothetical protein